MARADGSSWPRISIVTPSLNQAGFLEATIRSVLLQGYPDLEYVVADGGSQDGSVAIIEKYAAYLADWWSRPDRGQSEAINKAFSRCTGRIWAWLNSDDVYLPGTLRRIAEVLGGGTRIVYGSSQFIDAAGRSLGPYPGEPLRRGWKRMQYWKGWPVPQPTLFFEASLFKEKGPLDETLHYALDYEWVIRVSEDVEPICLPDTLAYYRVHPASKTAEWDRSKQTFFAEMRVINRRQAPWWRPGSWPLWLSWAGNRLAERGRRMRKQSRSLTSLADAGSRTRR